MEVRQAAAGPPLTPLLTTLLAPAQPHREFLGVPARGCRAQHVLRDVRRLPGGGDRVSSPFQDTQPEGQGSMSRILHPQKHLGSSSLIKFPENNMSFDL